MLNRLIAGPLSQSEIQATIDKLVARILMHSAPSQIILFGSAARGEAREGSDIDLAIDMLSPGRWTGIIKSFPEFNRFVFSDNPKLIYRLSFRQQAIIRYHLLKQEDEMQNAKAARGIMLRFLNGKV